MNKLENLVVFLTNARKGAQIEPVRNALSTEANRLFTEHEAAIIQELYSCASLDKSDAGQITFSDETGAIGYSASRQIHDRDVKFTFKIEFGEATQSAEDDDAASRHYAEDDEDPFRHYAQ